MNVKTWVCPPPLREYSFMRVAFLYLCLPFLLNYHRCLFDVNMLFINIYVGF